MARKTNFTIGMDLDNTLANALVITEAINELGFTGYSECTPRDWSSSNFPDALRNRINEMYISIKYMCDNLKVIDGSKELIRKLKAKGHKLIIITARHDALKRKTKSFIRNHFPEIDDIHFVAPHETKKNLFVKLNLEFWVDDAPHEIKHAMELGIRCFMVSNETTTYNHGLRKTKGLKVIKSVKELRLKDFKK